MGPGFAAGSPSDLLCNLSPSLGCISDLNGFLALHVLLTHVFYFF